jgi:hypothetical protein
MGRTVAVVWHALFSVVAGFLYFFFVLPRWWELSGDTSHTFGTIMRIVTGVLIALAALPVVFTLLRTRRPEYGTPQLALRLRVCSIALHVLGGVLIIGAAISEIWFSLDQAGRWLFGSYGAAAAICLLGIFSFYLAFVAELPPPPPRPLKKRKERKRRWRRKGAAEAGDADQAEGEAEEGGEAAADEAAEGESGEPEDEAVGDVDEADKAEETVTAETPTEAEATDDTVAAESARGGLHNRRPSGKIRRPRLRRKSGGVTVEE